MTTDPHESNELFIQLLGGFSIRVGNAVISVDAWRSKRARSLLKLVALAQGHSLKRDQAIETLWPDADPQSGANNLYQALHSIRSVLEACGAGSLVLEDGTLRLTGLKDQALWVDVDQFEAAAARTKGSQDPGQYQAALAWYQGDLLPEDLYEEWTIQRREALRQECLKLLVDLARLEESRQDYAAGIEALKRAIHIDQSYEEAHDGLMRLYILSGQRQLALRQYQVLKEVMWNELETEPSDHITLLYEEIRSGHTSPPLGGSERSVDARPRLSEMVGKKHHNLPQRLSSFIGHEKEIDHLLSLLKSTRLLTITGSGGVGKTSMALQVATYLLNAFADGVWLIELAPVTDPKMVPLSIAHSLGLPDGFGKDNLEDLIGYFHDKRLLLVLDNCEHLIDASAMLTERLLKNCPGLAILATSREALGIAGETPFRLPSLSVPDPQKLPPLEEFARFDAVRLFLERASAVQPAFALTVANALAIAQICQQLGGIPLAIELAAARLSMMTPGEISARLDNAFQLLTSGSRTTLLRQQTLKAAIDWSYNLLTSEEQLLFQRLSVFAGGWNIEAVEALYSDKNNRCDSSSRQVERREGVDVLAQLVNKSLVIAEVRGTETRYFMLETIRQYGRARLAEAGCEPVARDWHLAYFAQFTGQAEPHIRGKGQVEWLARLDEELDNLRTAMEWSLKGRIESGLKIVTDLMWYWHIRDLFQEHSIWLERFLTAYTTEGDERVLDPERLVQQAKILRAMVRIMAHPSRGFKGGFDNDRVESLQETVTLLRKSASCDRRELAISLLFLLSAQSKHGRPSPEGEEMLTILSEKKDFYLAEYFYYSGRGLASQGNLDQARANLEESLKICLATEDLDGVSSRKFELAILALYSGEYSRAEAVFKEGISIAQQVKNRWFETDIYVGLLWVALAQGNYQEASRISEEARLRYQELNGRGRIARLLWHLQQIHWSQGDDPQAIRFGAELIEGYTDYPYEQMVAYLYQGRVALSQNDPNQAKELLSQAFARATPNDEIHIRVMLLLGWVCLASKQGKFKEAARMIGALATIYPRISPSLTPRERREYDDVLGVVRAGLDNSTFTEAWQAGVAMSLDQALEAAKADLG